MLSLRENLWLWGGACGAIAFGVYYAKESKKSPEQKLLEKSGFYSCDINNMTGIPQEQLIENNTLADTTLWTGNPDERKYGSSVTPPNQICQTETPKDDFVTKMATAASYLGVSNETLKKYIKRTNLDYYRGVSGSADGLRNLQVPPVQAFVNQDAEQQAWFDYPGSGEKVDAVY